MSKDIFFLLLTSVLFFFHQKQKEWCLKDKLIATYLLCHCFLFTNEFATIQFWTQFQMMSAGILFFYLISTDKIDKELIFSYIRAAGLIQTIWLIFSFFEVEIYYYFFKIFNLEIGFEHYQSGVAVGSLGNSMLSGAFTALTIPAFFVGDYFIYIPILLAAILMTNSQMALITAVGIIGYFFIHKKFKLNVSLYIIFFVCCLIAIFYGFNQDVNHPFSDSGRVEIWISSFKNFNNFLIGKGLGYFANHVYEHAMLGKQIVTQMHNEYLEAFYALGALGCAPMIYFLIKILKAKNVIILAGVFGVAVNCFANFSFHISPIAMLSLVYLGIGLGEHDV